MNKTKCTFKIFLLILILFSLSNAQVFSDFKPGKIFQRDGFDSVHYVTFTPNNIHTWIVNTGIFNQNITSPNVPGFQWPLDGGRFANFTTGLTIMAYVDGKLRMAAASYEGEYLSGKVVYNGNIPEGYTDSTFKIYMISSGDDCLTNQDWANWGLMVPYGAPYIDFNNNAQYDACIDTPGVRNAEQTTFVYMTDAFISRHNSSEGFGGGTLPLNAEVSFTMWGYDGFAVSDMQFMKWRIVNKNTVKWDSVFAGIICDPDIGDATDDYVGCDSAMNLSYAYNSDNMDGDGTGNSYGLNPPATGFLLLESPVVGQSKLNLTSLSFFTNPSTPSAVCERDPDNPIEAYNYLKGFKSDGTPWLNPMFNPRRRTKFCYTGDPETATGWTEYVGKIDNCNGIVIGNIVPSPGGDRRMIMSTGSNQLFMQQNDTMEIAMAQLIARGTNNRNSVTRLKLLTEIAHELYENGFVNVGISQISTIVPERYRLLQNYPNPFNPTTKIGFEILKAGPVNINVYDISGKKITTLVSENLNPGAYTVNFSGSELSSGIYFYVLESSGYRETRKMTLLK